MPQTGGGTTATCHTFPVTWTATGNVLFTQHTTTSTNATARLYFNGATATPMMSAYEAMALLNAQQSRINQMGQPQQLGEGQLPNITPQPNPDRVAAARKARAILESFLDVGQRLDLASFQSFDVEGKSGRQYRVTWGRSGNILRFEGGGMMTRLCCHPGDLDLPIGDVMLAQLLHIKDDDEGFCRIANNHGRCELPPLRQAS